MKKLFYSLILIIPFVFYGCGSSSSSNNNTPIIQGAPSTNAELQLKYQYSILRADNVTYTNIFIDNVSQLNGDTVTITMDNQDNYTVSQYFSVVGYNFNTSRKTQETAIDNVYISVTNRLGDIILNEQVPVYTVHKIFPFYYQNNQMVPYLDNHEYTIGYGQKEIILFNQIGGEFRYINNGDGHTTIDNETLYGYFLQFGFNNTFDNITTYNNFEVNNTTDNFTVDNVIYPNCLKIKSIKTCALEVTNNNNTDTTAEFYLRTLARRYLDNKLILKSSAQ